MATDESVWPRIWNLIQEMIFTVPSNLETGELEVNGVQVARDKFPAVQRNAASVKDKTRVLPKPVTLTVNIDGLLHGRLSIPDLLETSCLQI